MRDHEARNRRAHGERRRPEAHGRSLRSVLLDRRIGLCRQPEALRGLSQEEERTETAGQLVGPGVARPVEVRAIQPARVQRRHAPLRHFDELVVRAELDRVRRARLRARGLEPVLEPVVTQRALRGPPVVRVAVDHPERTGGHAVAAAVADVRLHDHGLELGADQRARRARVEAARVRAVLADVRHEEPLVELRDAVRLGPLNEIDVVLPLRDRLDEAHVPPSRRAQPAGAVVRAALAEHRAVARQVVPLLTCDLARLAADTDGRVREEPHPLGGGIADRDLGHGLWAPEWRGCSDAWSRFGLAEWAAARSVADIPGTGARERRPARTLHANDLSSIETFGSPVRGTRSFAASPVTPWSLVV